ncbi:spermatogenesis-associated protein 24 isoform X2 [Leopardus geoffroyi]|uniref:spermatogenesis-associated protein 24 isoform X2 n=1 Tax=Leopardus geoffroyi TaxID=46844 RepID=UPI001E264AEB|nr:spermatogenesis-associated protein 24 isoform X2 [Leopardus geoffroyi]
MQMVLQDENFVSKEEFQAVEKKLVEEKAAHAKTKVLLAKEEEKLQFALGEVEVLSKQLEKEKLAFEKALSSVKSRALQESSKKDQLITKCNEIESHIIKQEDILNGKENEIKELQQVISQQKQIFSPCPASSIAGITCLTTGSRSNRRTTWPKCWTRSIRKPRGRVRPGATSIPGKNKIVFTFLFCSCNAGPLPSLLWGSPSLWVSASATSGLTSALTPREEAEGTLFFFSLPASWAFMTEGRIKLLGTGWGTGLGPLLSMPLLGSEKDAAQVSSPCWSARLPPLDSRGSESVGV